MSGGREIYTLGDGRMLFVLVQAEAEDREKAKARVGGPLRRPEAFARDSRDISGRSFVPVFTDPDLARDNLKRRGLVELGLGVEGPLDAGQRAKLFENCIVAGVSWFAVDLEPDAVWLTVHPLDELELVVEGTLETS